MEILFKNLLKSKIMTIKLTADQLQALIAELRDGSERVSFNTKLEAKLSGAVLKEFFVKLMKKALDMKAKYKLELNEKEMLVLNHVLPQLNPVNTFNATVIAELHLKINQLCLSI
jgi:hypothetical protein